MSLNTIFAMLMLPAVALNDSPRSPNEIWINRAWEIRYIIEVLDNISLQVSQEESQSQRTQNGGPDRYQSFESLVSPQSSIAVRPGDFRHILALEFGRAGKLLTKHNASVQLYGRRSITDGIALAGEDVPYAVAEWFHGLHGAGTEFAPAVCDVGDMLNRYQDDWDSDDYRYGNFGCREWTHQLYASNSAYIDVTSYSRFGASIGRFVGWARFTDPHRPVIGKNGKRWYCLYECPPGERPGPIADIKTWTKRHGFPMPRGPHKQPEFPDRNYSDEWAD